MTRKVMDIMRHLVIFIEVSAKIATYSVCKLLYILHGFRVYLEYDFHNK